MSSELPLLTAPSPVGRPLCSVNAGPGSHFDLRLFCLATFAACLPNAVRTAFGKCAIVRFFFAAAAAFLMFFFAAVRCRVLAISSSFSQ